MLRFIAILAVPALLLAAPLSAQETKPKPMTPGGVWPKGSMERPRPRVVTPPGHTTQEAPGQPPSDAIVLFSGADLAQWKSDRKDGDDDSARWKVENGYFEVVKGTGGIRTREEIEGDCQWHIEWATPAEVSGQSQGRGNSGVFIGGFPEVQVLDSYQNDTYPDGQAASLYNQYPPLVNASRPPGQWQTYDIIVEREKKDEKGNVIRKANITVLHNGVVVHYARETGGGTKGGLALQDHGNPVRYRNIWARKLNLVDPDREGTPPPAKP